MESLLWTLVFYMLALRFCITSPCSAIKIQFIFVLSALVTNIFPNMHRSGILKDFRLATWYSCVSNEQLLFNAAAMLEKKQDQGAFRAAKKLHVRQRQAAVCVFHCVATACSEPCLVLCTEVTTRNMSTPHAYCTISAQC